MIDILSGFPQHILLASRDAAVLAFAIGILLWIFGRRIAPAWRHMLWLLVAVRLVLPVLPSSPVSWQRLVPSKSLEIVTVVKNTHVAEISKTISIKDTSEIISNEPVVSDPAPRLPKTVTPASSTLSLSPKFERESGQPGSWNTMEVLGLVWAVGFICFLMLIGVIALRFRRRLQRLTICDHQRFEEIAVLMENLCREMNIRRIPHLRITEAVSSPALTGLFRPEILLAPNTIERLNVSELRLVVLHELGHMRRRDLWTNWMLSILQAIHWFNPLIWWAFHRIRIEGERATDAWVLEHSGAEQSENYGQALIQLLKSSARPSLVAGVVGVIESRRDLRNRLAAIATFTGRKSNLAVVGAVLLIAGCAAIGLTAAPEKNKKEVSPIESKQEKNEIILSEEISKITAIPGSPVKAPTIARDYVRAHGGIVQQIKKALASNPKSYLEIYSLGVNWARQDFDAVLHALATKEIKWGETAKYEFSEAVWLSAVLQGGDEMERLMKPDPQLMARVNFNSHTLGPVARAEPERLIKYAEAYLKGSNYSSAMAHAVSEIANRDPNKAKEIMAKMVPGPARERVASFLGGKFVRADIASSLDWAFDLPNAKDREAALSTISTHWGSKDPEAAANYIQFLDKTPDRSVMLQNVAVQWAARDGEKAITWLREMDPNHPYRSGPLQVWAANHTLKALKYVSLNYENKPGAFIGRKEVENTYRLGTQYNPKAAAAAVSLLRDDELEALLTERIIRRWKRIDPTAVTIWLHRHRGAVDELEKLVLGDPEPIEDAPIKVVKVDLTERGKSMTRLLQGILKKFPDPQRGFKFIIDVFLNWAKEEPEAAFEWAKGNLTGVNRNEAVALLLKELAQKDPRMAAAWIDEMGPGSMRNLSSYTVANHWALNDLEGTLEWATSLPESGSRKIALQTIAVVWVSKNSATSAATRALLIPEGSARLEFAGQVVRLWAGIKPTDAMGWIRANFQEREREDLILSVLGPWSHDNPAETADFIKPYPEGDAKNHITDRIANSWASWDPEAAAKWVQSLVEGKGRNDAAYIVAKHWIPQEPKDASAWIDQLPAGDSKVQAIRALKQFEAIHASSVAKADTALAASTKRKPFKNYLGMSFVPVPITGGPTSGQTLFFSIWETRVNDYEQFINENSEHKWREADFKQRGDHPAVQVNWQDAVTFCAWLTNKERKLGKLAEDKVYRLPTDHEWSCAVGIGKEEAAQVVPKAKNGKLDNIYFWGRDFPPSRLVGNFNGEETKQNPIPKQLTIKGYNDGIERTAPVGSFEVNEFGLYDMGGNVWEWVQDLYDPTDKERRLLRGACWNNWREINLLASKRLWSFPNRRNNGFGFRVVIASAVDSSE